MAVQLFRIVLPVGNINNASRFYTHVLGTPGQRVSAGRHYFDCGGVILACFDPKADGDKFDARANQDHIYFAVDDLDVVFARAKAAGCGWLEDDVKTRPWGERSFYLKDPFGNPLCFVDAKTAYRGK